jgi:DNA-directed RNA polymerase specialized sigma24 family protein
MSETRITKALIRRAEWYARRYCGDTRAPDVVGDALLKFWEYESSGNLDESSPLCGRRVWALFRGFVRYAGLQSNLKQRKTPLPAETVADLDAEFPSDPDHFTGDASGDAAEVRMIRSYDAKKAVQIIHETAAPVERSAFEAWARGDLLLEAAADIGTAQSNLRKALKRVVSKARKRLGVQAATSPKLVWTRPTRVEAGDSRVALKRRVTACEHTDRPHAAHGLCQPCYRATRPRLRKTA